jgi:hypothetical protein
MLKMPPVLSKLKYRVLHSQTREVVCNVLHFVEQDGEQGSFSVPISKAQEKTETATGVNVRSVRRIKSEGKSLVVTGQGNCSFSTPNNNNNNK